MNGFGEYAFTGAAFTLNEDRGMVRLRRFARHFQHLAHDRILRNHATEIVAALGTLHGVAHADPQ